MNRHLSILLLFCVYSHVYAQTPYDAFAPEVSRPILDVVQNLDAYQPRTLYDIMSGRMNLYWDANGNIAEIIHCEQDAGRFHEWDEDNRLRFVLGERFAGYYGYDANGERVYKLTGTCGIDQINHNGTRAYVMFDDAVLYPNPYLVVTPRGYTKHYYAGTERLATAIGSGGFDDMGLTIGHYDSREEDIAQMFYANYQNEDPFYYDHILSEMIGTSTIEGDNMPGLEYCQEPIILGRVDVIGGEDLLYSSIYDNLLVRDRERELFFSHSDHLGSANWITDYDGIPIQYLHYAPYGELVENQRVTDYDERYKFTGKERDWETGYDYFGARYWWLAGTWLSVDPLSDKYPQISPYAYCGWNPIKYVDPDGRAIHVAVGAVIGAAIGGTISGISAMNDPTKSGRQVLGAIAGGALSGAITGGAAALTGGLSFIGTGGTIAASAVAGLIGESAGSAVSQSIGNGEIDGGEVARAGLVGAAAGVITGAASKGVSEAVKKSGVVQNIQTKMLDGVKSGTGKAAKQQANQTRKSIINFCSPGNDKQFQMKDLITYPADVVGQEVSTGVTTSGAVVDKTQEVQSNVANKLGL